MNKLIKAYVSRSAIRHNVKLIMNKTDETPICAAVKANAYGHGVAIVSSVLSGLDISFWGVATLLEAIELRDLKLTEPILIFRPVGDYGSMQEIQEQIDLILEFAFRATVVNEEGLDLLARIAAVNRKPAYVHIKVDTGMGRSGCPQKKACDLALKASRIPAVNVEGIYSHFATTDEDHLDFAHEQLSVFLSILKEIESRGIHIPIKHMAGSGAIFNIPGSWLDMIRPGSSLYGYGCQLTKVSKQLVPVLRVEAPVLMTKRISKGSSCGYGCTFVAKRDMRIGLLPIGYADGYSRKLSNAGQVDFSGRFAPVIGRVSMDLTIIDLTDIPEAEIGSQACVISNRREDPHSVQSMAIQVGTIPHEITCLLGRRIQRVMVD